jgi:chromosome segregation ATPase
MIISESFAFIVPTAPSYGPHSRIRLTDKDEHQDVQRYRNRAALTESVLKEKMQEMKLLRSKVQILQDVVKKLQSGKEQAAESASVQEEQLTLQWKQEETKRIKADLQIEQLKSELNLTRSELKTQATRHNELMDNLKKDHGRDRRAWKDEERQFLERDQVVQNKIRALQKEVLDIDESLETTQGELMRVQQRLASREDELRSLASTERGKREALEEKLEEALVENKNLHSKLEGQLASEEVRRESIDIASAAVRAAEKREAKLREELETLREQLVRLEARKEDMSQEREMERRTNENGRQREGKDFEEKQSADWEMSKSPLRSMPLIEEAEVVETFSDSNAETGETVYATADRSETLNDSNETRDSSKPQGGRWRRLRSPRSWFSTRRYVRKWAQLRVE